MKFHEEIEALQTRVTALEERLAKVEKAGLPQDEEPVDLAELSFEQLRAKYHAGEIDAQTFTDVLLKHVDEEPTPEPAAVADPEPEPAPATATDSPASEPEPAAAEPEPVAEPEAAPATPTADSPEVSDGAGQ